MISSFPSSSSPVDASSFFFPQKPGLLSRQQSIDLFSSLTYLARQSSFPTLPDDPFDFSLSFDDIKPDTFPFSSTRSSSMDSEGAWSVDSPAPLSPHSSVDSVDSMESISDSSQSSEELFSPLPQSSVWYQEQVDRGSMIGKDMHSCLPSSIPDLQRSLSTSSPLPVLPLPFTQPLYSFNYSPEDDFPSNSTSSSSGRDRKGGLCGGTRDVYRRYISGQQEAEEGRRTEQVEFSPASFSSSTASSASSLSPFVDPANISPKSLLLSLSTPSSSSSISSSSSTPSYTSASAKPYLDPNEIVIGIYTRAERAAKIARYREKRANRQWKKKILYNCRKSFADNRPRVGGRFIKMDKGNEEKSHNKTQKGKGGK